MPHDQCRAASAPGNGGSVLANDTASDGERRRTTANGAGGATPRHTLGGMDRMDESREPLVRLADGTVKQVNPFSGTEVWTVPGRAHRPIPSPVADVRALGPDEARRRCAFCEERYLETTPESGRWIRSEAGWRYAEGLTLEEVLAAPAEFRRVPNLFEILSFDFWHLNYGFTGSPAARAHQAIYLGTDTGRQHVVDLARTKLRAMDVRERDLPSTLEELHADDPAILGSFFSGSHDVVIARRHYVPNATHTDQLASAGTLTRDEHAAFIRATISSAQALVTGNPHARYVSIFQNWLQAAGASFEHLHKQIVGIDTIGARTRAEFERLREDPLLYQRWGPDFARQHGLLIAENAYAVAFAGVGHRFPGVDIFTKVNGVPWELPPEVIQDWSDLLHACHAATGPLVPSNEEWHYQPHSMPGVVAPLRAVLKWRINTPAGFEGGTNVFINTLDPWAVAERVKGRLREVRASGVLGELTLS